MCTNFFAQTFWTPPGVSRERKKGVITKGVFSLEQYLESLNSLNSLESLENGRILLYFPQSGGSLKSLESLENGLFWKDPFSKRPLFPNPSQGHAGKIPGTFQIPLLETQGRQTFEGRHELLGRHPFAWKTPTPPGGLRTQKVDLCALFRAWIKEKPTLSSKLVRMSPEPTMKRYFPHYLAAQQRCFPWRPFPHYLGKWRKPSLIPWRHFPHPLVNSKLSPLIEEEFCTNFGQKPSFCTN